MRRGKGPYYWVDTPIGKVKIKHTVKRSEEGRPDLISFRYYGTPELYWYILVANRKTIFELKAGDVIDIPEVQVDTG